MSTWFTKPAAHWGSRAGQCRQSRSGGDGGDEALEALPRKGVLGFFRQHQHNDASGMPARSSHSVLLAQPPRARLQLL
jgi:hypothetical protein